jgi:hypothetical protein
MTLDSSGNLGLGVTPSAWGSTYHAIQIGSGAGVQGVGTQLALRANSYYTGTGDFFLTGSGKANSLAIDSGSGFVFYQSSNSSSGVGSAVTYTQAMTLDNSGNLNLLANFYIGDASHATSQVSSGSGAAPLIFGINGTEKARIDTGGNFFVNTTAGFSTASNRGNISLNGTSTAIVALGTGGTRRGYLYTDGSNITVGADAALVFEAGGSERARIDSSGNFCYGVSSFSAANNGFLVAANGSSTYIAHASGTASGATYSYFYYNNSVIGSITQSGTTAVLYNLTSDQRLKENIQDAAPASALIDAIQVRQYNWKSDGSHQRYGFIAQELVTVAPEAVHQPADPEEMMAVDYSKLVPMLVKEIQDLRKRLAAAGI